MNGSQRKVPWGTSNIQLEEWDFLAKLLQSGYPLEAALEFLDIPTKDIKMRLKQGRKLEDALFYKQDDTFCGHVRFFLKLMPLEKAIQQAVALTKVFEDIKQKLKKSAIYPMILLLSAFVLLMFFTNAIIPSMIQTFEGDVSFQHLSRIVSAIRFLCVFFLIIFVIMVFVILYFYIHKTQRNTLLMKHMTKLNQEYISFRFATYLIQLHQNGISTMQMMDYFIQLPKEQLFTMYMQKLNTKLLLGNELYKSMEQLGCFTTRFLKSFQLGMAANSVGDFLEAFKAQQLHAWQKKLHKISIYLQIIAYSFVGMVVFLVYQIMLVPLGMLESM